MRFSLYSSAFLIGSNVLGFAPSFTPKSFLVKNSRLDATVSISTPSTEPEIFFQKRIAEPIDISDVPAAAFYLSSTFPEKPFIVQYRNSGHRPGYLNKSEESDFPILDLSVLKKIKIDDDGEWIQVDAGVTVGKLAEELRDLGESPLNELFIALPANPHLSIVEAVFDKRFDKLDKAVKEVHVVDNDGNIISKQLSDIRKEVDIVVNIVFSPELKATSSNKDVIARWYARDPFASSPMVKGFISDIPDTAKVMVFKYGMFNPLPYVVVFNDGEEEIDLPNDWKETVVNTPEQYWRLQKNLFTSACFDALTTSAFLDVSESDIDPSFADILGVFYQRKEHLLVTVENNKIRASFDAQYPPDVDEATSELFTFDEREPFMIAPEVDSKPLMKMNKNIAGPNLKIESGTVIEGFKGEIYDGTRCNFQDKRWQYATSSYDNMMNPAIVAYPVDENDVSLVIKWATLPEFEEARKSEARPSGRPFKVMGRGGGHHYCGVSCENGALILSMNLFNKTESKEVNLVGVTGPDGMPQDVTVEVNVGTGAVLEGWATFANTDPKTNCPARYDNDNLGFTIPHGECPKVGIGGHSQSGGYGHISRNFGLAIDYIYGFTIVTANGEIRTVNRDSTEQADKDLYWAVLGGSPGAFGVTTNLVIHPILDKDWPNSTGFSAVTLFSKKSMEAALDILQDFINRSKEDIAEGLDLQISLSSRLDNDCLTTATFEQSLILFELECRDKTDEKAYGQMKELMTRYKEEVDLCPLIPFMKIIDTIYGKNVHKLDGEKHYKLSEMSRYFARSAPDVTSDGRENKRPYHKAGYGSKGKLKPGWSKAFAGLLNEVVHSKADVHCIFQVCGIAGGASERFGKAELNAISHRDAQLVAIIFDLFRGDDEESIKAAASFQDRFEFDIVNKYQTSYPKVMAQSYPHGDLDMNKEEVWEKYIDKPETYHRLRRIKREVDPNDVFHSRFTVRPADD